MATTHQATLAATSSARDAQLIKNKSSQDRVTSCNTSQDEPIFFLCHSDNDTSLHEQQSVSFSLWQL